MRTLVLSLALLSGCSFGFYVDRLEDGSKIQTSYQKNRYQHVNSGMAYASEQIRPAPSALQQEETTIEASPRNAWKGFLAH